MYECSFAVGVGEKIPIKKKRGDSVVIATPNLDISNVKHDLVPVLACFPVLIEFIDFESLKQ